MLLQQARLKEKRRAKRESAPSASDLLYDGVRIVSRPASDRGEVEISHSAFMKGSWEGGGDEALLKLPQRPVFFSAIMERIAHEDDPLLLPTTAPDAHAAPTVWMCIRQELPEPSCPAHVFVLSSLELPGSPSLGGRVYQQLAGSERDSEEEEEEETSSAERRWDCDGATTSGSDLVSMLDDMALTTTPAATLMGQTFVSSASRRIGAAW